ncbi:hypothetical protein [Spirosoma sp. KUDC1026]|uniref:hypothetical protein n=1 Tax=Spirosoma sp. KUDC1026 TaxID=2745947 RepID=UPI00159BB3DC|nr:hypothetical protein [Spirosoma sp. KUDC1026]QKZ15198.1 hypothetical protein HU175_22255 [Spirosoma sp. KUDC1026]
MATLRKSKPTNKKVPVTQSRTVTGFLDWGWDNLYPQTLLDVIDESDTASAAMSVRAEFIEGNGLKDLALSEMIVNRKGETFDDVHAANCSGVADLEVICLHLSFNALAEIVGMQHVPPEQVRFMAPDDLGNITRAGIFPYLGSTLFPKRAKEHKVVHLFNPRKEVVFAQIEEAGGIEKYQGQLVHVIAGTRRKGEVYHTPSYAGGSVMFEAEKELSTYYYRVVTQDFATSGVFKTLKKSDARDEGNRDEDSIQNRLTQHQGAENAASIVCIEADTIEELEAMEFMPTSGSDLSNRYTAMGDYVAEHISRRTRVPNELMGVRKSTGGISFTQIQIKLFSQLMQQTVNRYQRSISRVYAQIFAHWHRPLGDRDFTIENLNYFPDDDGTAAIAE